VTTTALVLIMSYLYLAANSCVNWITFGRAISKIVQCHCNRVTIAEPPLLTRNPEVQCHCNGVTIAGPPLLTGNHEVQCHCNRVTIAEPPLLTGNPEDIEARFGILLISARCVLRNLMTELNYDFAYVALLCSPSFYHSSPLSFSLGTQCFESCFEVQKLTSFLFPRTSE
jgi:hypothetical protein